MLLEFRLWERAAADVDRTKSKNPCKKSEFYDEGETLKNFTKKASMTGFGFLSFKGERGPKGNKTGDRVK